jgi:hypothetical protein
MTSKQMEGFVCAVVVMTSVRTSEAKLRDESQELFLKWCRKCMAFYIYICML